MAKVKWLHIYKYNIKGYFNRQNLYNNVLSIFYWSLYLCYCLSYLFSLMYSTALLGLSKPAW